MITNATCLAAVYMGGSGVFGGRIKRVLNLILAVLLCTVGTLCSCASQVQVHRSIQFM